MFLKSNSGQERDEVTARLQSALKAYQEGPVPRYYYTKIHGRAPAELDMQRYFNVSPPSIHQMMLRLEANGFIERVP